MKTAPDGSDDAPGKTRTRDGAGRIVLVYAIFASLWILLSDWVLVLLVSDPLRIAFWSTVKGWLFVAVTSLLLFGLIQRQLGQMLKLSRLEREAQAESKAAAGQIHSLAFSDPLTGLPNRRLFMDRLEQAMAAGLRHQRQGAIIFVDLDDFKTINEVLGHETGDLLPQQVAKRLGGCVRDGDTVARLGGDEFVMLLEDLGQAAQEAATQAEAVSAKMLLAMNQPYQLGTSAHHSTCSIGITLFGSQDEKTVDALMRAELAMYQAKAAGRNVLRFFEPQMQAVVSARAALEVALREAIGKQQFLLHYQPQVTGDGTIIGAEALVRWQDPRRGMVSPVEFIPLAEETGLILPLGSWVLETACSQLARWARQPEIAHLTVSVNVSARQFHQDDFVAQILAVLKSTGANPRRLKLELTESLLVTEIEEVIAKMNALKGKGVGFSIDDFGTGYSSLSYLKRLPLDQLKIDQGFVRDILIDPNDAAIAKMVVALADSLGLMVIAEGVETQAQRDFLAGLGCRNYQGYLFSRPLPLQEFEALVRRGL
ncbi:MAG: putative bifunctional diguanylate cyclase/phosphodiesterase [Rhodoferax sp.]